MSYTPRNSYQIYQSMLANMANKPGLAALTDTSPTNAYRQIFLSMAEMISLHEQQFEAMRKSVLDQSAAGGSRMWYAAEARKFQMGYNLSYENRKWYYETEDTNAQIIKFVAADYNDVEKLVLRVAGIDNGNLARELTALELYSFNDYIQSIKFAGTFLDIVSQDGDRVKLSLTVLIDRTIISTDGTIVGGTAKPVEIAVVEYLQSFQGEYFGNFISYFDLLKVIASVSGVKSVAVDEFQAKSIYSNSYINILSSPMQTYTTAAGWAKVAEDYPLSNHITYI